MGSSGTHRTNGGTRRRAGLALAAALFLLGASALADDVLIWNAEPFPSSGPQVQTVLENLGYTVTSTTSLDTVTLTDYDYVFVFLGMFFDNYVIETGSAEETALVNYLNAGGRLFVEGGDFAHDNPENLLPMFNVVLVDDGEEVLNTATGVDGTFTEGMAIDYGGSSFFIDNLQAGEGAQRVMFNPIDNSGIGIVYDAGGWKTALFSFQTGLLTDGDPPNTRADLFNGLMGWFGPGIPSPTDLTATLNHTNGMVDLLWNYEEDPDYTLTEFRIYRDGSQVATTTDTSYTDQLVDYGSHSYRVTAYYATPDRESSWAGPATVVWLAGGELSPDPFSLVAPADGSTFEAAAVNFQWQATTDGNPGDTITYVLQVDTDSTFADPELHENGQSTSLEVTGFEDDSTYWWRVHAQDLNTDGTLSTESWSFTMRLPDPPEDFALVSPVQNGHVPDQTPTLVWEQALETDVEDSVSYVLHWALNPSFADESVISGLTDTSYTFPNQIAVGTTVYWKVKALDTNTSGTWCSPEEGWYFQVNFNHPPEPFSLISPAHQAVVEVLDVPFLWHATTDQDAGDFLTYEVELAFDTSFTSPSYHFADTDTSLTVEGLLDDTEYFWRVHAWDTNTNGTFSQEWRSFLTARPEPPDSFALIAPADWSQVGYETNYTTLYDWEDSEDPDPGETVSYNLHFRAELPGGDEQYVLAGLLFSEQMVGIADSFSVSDWNEWVNVRWWVEAVSAGDSYSTPVRTIQVAPHGVWVEEGAGGIPREFALASVYPNPFNPTATVRVGLPRTAKLEAALYDLLGRRVAVLAEGALPPGWHELTLDGAALPSGSYFVRVVVPGELNATRRVQLVR